MSLPNPIIIDVSGGDTLYKFNYDDQQVDMTAEKLKELLRNHKNGLSQSSSSSAVSIPLISKPTVLASSSSYLPSESIPVQQAYVSSTPPRKEKYSDETKLSPYSGAKRVETAEVSGGIYLRAFVDIRGNIHLHLNRDLRPPTSISRSQGDHVTPYRILLQMICNITKGEEVSSAAEILRDAVACFLDPDTLPDRDINNIPLTDLLTGEQVCLKTQIEEIKELCTSRQLRKEVTGLLRSRIGARLVPAITSPEASPSSSSGSSSTFQQRNTNKVRDSINRGDQLLFAQLIVELGESVLQHYQKQKFSALPKLKGYDAGDSEGDRVKKTICYLRIINELLIFKEHFRIVQLRDDNVTGSTIELLKGFHEQCKDIILSSYPTIVHDERYDEHFQGALEATGVKQDLIVKLPKLSKLSTAIHGIPVSDSFDGKIDVKAVEAVVKNAQIAMTSAVAFVEMIEHVNLSSIGDLFNAIFDFHREKFKVSRKEEGTVIKEKGKEKIVLKDPGARLYEVAKKHLDFMFTSFKGMRKLSNEAFESIIKCFCQKVGAEEGHAKSLGANSNLRFQ